MSVRCISQVLEKSVHSGTALLMLVVLADYSDDDGNSYPSVSSLARKCRMQPRNANYILKELQDSGELRVLKNQGPKGTNRYRIMLALLGVKTLQSIAPLQDTAPLQRSAPISTYVWIISNRKPAARKGKVQLIDASDLWQKMRKSLGSKRKELSDDHIDQITKLFGDFVEAEQDGKPISRIFKNAEFGYRTITVERPLRDAAGRVVLGEKGKQKGKPQPDSALRDTENVPLAEDVEAYFTREVLPHAPDAWIDHEKTKVGYEIPFNRHFYVFTPPRPLAEIDVELKQTTDRILEMIKGLSA